MNNAIGEIDDYTIFRTFWVAAGLMVVTFAVAFYFAKIKSSELELH